MTVSLGRRPSPALVAGVIAATWVVVAVVLYGLRYWSGHDESVYISKALGSPAPFNWGYHRALGMPAILSPATSLGFGVTASRVTVVAFNAALLGIGLWQWSRVYGRWVVLGPAAVAFSWLGLNNASAIMPNMPTAMALFATVPVLWLALTRPSRLHQGATIAGFVLIGLLRPTALVWVTVGIAVALLDPSVRSHTRRLVGLLAVALPLALLTWTVESFVTFGLDPVERLRLAGTAITSYEHENVVLTLLRSVAHPSGSDNHVIVLLVALGAASMLIALAFTALEGSARGALTITTCVGISKIMAYVLFPSEGSARFLIPGLLCVSVGIGLGLRTLVASHTWRTAAAAALLIACLGWQLGVARNDANAVREARSAVSAAIANMRQISDGASCAYESNTSAASFYLGSACEGGRSPGAERSMLRMEDRPDTSHAFLVWRGPIEPRPGWTLVDIGIDARWKLYHYPDSSGS